MRNTLFTLALGGALAFGVSALAQDNAAQPQTQSPDQAQGQGPMRMDPNRQLEHMTRALGLSADQQNQIRPLLVDRQQKMEALFQDQSGSRQDRHAKMQSIRQDSETKIEAVLNDQQKQKFAAMQEHMRGGRGRWQGGQQGAPQPQ
jgi:hypothetical protein